MNFQQAFTKIYAEDSDTLINQFTHIFPQHKLWLMPALLNTKINGVTIKNIELNKIRKTYAGFIWQVGESTPYNNCSIFTLVLCDYLFDKYSELLLKKSKSFINVKMYENELSLRRRGRIEHDEDMISRMSKASKFNNVVIINHARN